VVWGLVCLVLGDEGTHMKVDLPFRYYAMGNGAGGQAGGEFREGPRNEGGMPLFSVGRSQDHGLEKDRRPV